MGSTQYEHVYGCHVVRKERPHFDNCASLCRGLEHGATSRMERPGRSWCRVGLWSPDVFQVGDHLGFALPTERGVSFAAPEVSEPRSVGNVGRTQGSP